MIARKTCLHSSWAIRRAQAVVPRRSGLTHGGTDFPLWRVRGLTRGRSEQIRLAQLRGRYTRPALPLRGPATPGLIHAINIITLQYVATHRPPEAVNQTPTIAHNAPRRPSGKPAHAPAPFRVPMWRPIRNFAPSNSPVRQCRQQINFQAAEGFPLPGTPLRSFARQCWGTASIALIAPGSSPAEAIIYSTRTSPARPRMRLFSSCLERPACRARTSISARRLCRLIAVWATADSKTANECDVSTLSCMRYPAEVRAAAQPSGRSGQDLRASSASARGYLPW